MSDVAESFFNVNTAADVRRATQRLSDLLERTTPDRP